MSAITDDETMHTLNRKCERLEIEVGRLTAELDEARRRERNDIIDCIRSTTWSGAEEIVAMIRFRISSRHQHVDASEEARKSDLLPVPKKGKPDDSKRFRARPE